MDDKNAILLLSDIQRYLSTGGDAMDAETKLSAVLNALQERESKGLPGRFVAPS